MCWKVHSCPRLQPLGPLKYLQTAMKTDNTDEEKGKKEKWAEKISCCSPTPMNKERVRAFRDNDNGHHVFRRFLRT